MTRSATILYSTRAAAAAFALSAVAIAIVSLRLVAIASPGRSTAFHSSARLHAMARQSVVCTGAITIADGVEIIGGGWGDTVTQTVRVEVWCDGALPAAMRYKAGSWSCGQPPATLDGDWEPYTTTFPVRLHIGSAWWPQSVLVQLRTRAGVESEVFCDDVVMHGHVPPLTPEMPGPTVQPPPNMTAPPAPIPTAAPTKTHTPGPSPTPTDGPPPPTRTPRTASVTGRIVLANGAGTISGALGHFVDVSLGLDLTASGAPLCQMRLRLSGGPCRDDADGGFATESWQPFHRVTGLEIPLAVHGSTISAWAQVTNADGDVSRAFCDDVVVHAPNTATPCGGSPTPRAPTPLPAVTSCPRWASPVFLPLVPDHPARTVH